MKARNLKIPFAVRGDRTVHVAEVESGLRKDCCCPQCGAALVARKGALKVHHFAHDGDHSCNEETILHLLAKQLLRDRLEAGLASGGILPIRWNCGRCQNEHHGNLLKRARTVRLEKGLAGKVPDLALLNQKGEACGVIEVVVSHQPEESAMLAYAARKIAVVEFWVRSVLDLIELRDAPELRPAKVSFCPVPAWQLQSVKLAGLIIRLDQVTVERKGAILHVLDRHSKGRGEHSVRAHFLFEHPEDAQVALDALKDGRIDGLNEPEWMLTQCKNRILHRKLVERLAGTLVQYRLEWQGFGKTKWRRR